MASGEYAPDIRTKPESVLQNLKYDVTLRGAVSLASQRSHAECVGCAICKIESTVDRKS